jgi:hypothetical protein
MCVSEKMENLIIDPLDIEKNQEPANTSLDFGDHILRWTLVVVGYKSPTKEFTCHTSSYYGKTFL